jgi:hypothetical protein
VDLNALHPTLVEEIKAIRTFEAMETAFAKVEQLTTTLQNPELFGRKLFTPDLDNMIPDLARSLGLIDAPHPKSNANVCILATQFYATGGHTRVVRDIADRLDPDNRPFVVLTNNWGGGSRYRRLLQGGVLGSDLKERAFLVLSAASRAEKAIELYMMLKAARPSRIVLMCHPFDIVAVVGCWPFRDVVEFMHHSDHVPALGASLPWSAHVDLTYTCHLACRGSGLDAVYAGMTSTVVGARPHAVKPSRLRIATCGDQRKYDGAARYRWADYAVAALRQPGAEILHIGGATEAFQADLRQALSAAGVDPERYVFVGPKPNLPETLIEHETDVYLSSYPVTGGKANLEAMIAGIPVILPVDEDVAPLLHFRLPLPHYLQIAAPEDLIVAIPKAIELGKTMGSPPELQRRNTEIDRFNDFVAGRPLSAAPPD